MEHYGTNCKTGGRSRISRFSLAAHNTLLEALEQRP